MLRPVCLPSVLSSVAAAALVLSLPTVSSAATTVSQTGNTVSIVGDDAPSALRHDGSYNGFQVYDTLGEAVKP